MRKIITVFLIILSNTLNAQNNSLKGVTIWEDLPNLPDPSFIIEDHDGAVWMGLSKFFGIDGRRISKGLIKITKDTVQVMHSTGMFTDAILNDTAMFISSYDGVATYVKGKNIQSEPLSKVNCIIFFKNELWAGTMGNGLYRKTKSGFQKVPVTVNNVTYDSILCIEKDGNNLWLGTNNGIIKYDGFNFTRYTIPYKPVKMTEWRSHNFIRSIKCDKNHVVWAMNDNAVDSFSCIFYMDNGVFFTDAAETLGQSCGQTLALPYIGLMLGKDQWGNIIIPANWGYLLINNMKVESRIIFPERVQKDIYKISFKFAINCNIKGHTVFNIGNQIIMVESQAYDFEQLKDIINSKNKTAIETLDINDIKTTVTNNNSAFNNMNMPHRLLGYPTITIPSLNCTSLIYSSGLWLSGRDMGDSARIKSAAQEYTLGDNDFLPGPLDTLTGQFDSTANMAYNKIWKIDHKTIDEFKTNYNQPGYTIPDEIRDWPTHGTGNFSRRLAPFIDLNKNGVYEPQAGDYPDMKGDQMLWWVCNDGRPHAYTKGSSMKLEIHGSCYAYYNIAINNTDSNALLNRSIFFNYKIINRGTTTLDSLTAGVFTDPDLGYYGDDYVACDTLNNAGICYNGDNYDETADGFKGLGKNPPLVYCKFLNRKMNSFIYFDNSGDPVFGNPENDDEYFNLMSCRWLNGNHIKYYDTTLKKYIETNYISPSGFCYPGNNGKKTVYPGDRRFVMGTESRPLTAGKLTELEYVYTFVHNPQKDFLRESCDTGTKILKRLQYWYDNKNFPSKPYYGVGTNAININGYSILLFPNPTHGNATLQSTILNSDIISIDITDISGKLQNRIYPESNGSTLNQTIVTDDLSKGIYLINIQTNDHCYSLKLLVY